jgi:hypothetical protein
MVRIRVPFIGDSNIWLGGEFRLSEIERMVRMRVPFIGDSNAWLEDESCLSEIAT